MNVVLDLTEIDDNNESQIVFFKREQLYDFVSKSKNFTIDPNYIFSIEINGEHFECAYIYKTKKNYNPICLLKNVIAPYQQNGVPRGWFHGLNNQPQRFTGISNSLYFNSTNRNLKIIMFLIILMQFNYDDNILTKSNDKDLLTAINILKTNNFESINDWIKYHIKNEKIDYLKNPEKNIEEFNKNNKKPVLQNISCKSA